MSYISCIETANPCYQLTQEQHMAFYCNTIANGDTSPARKIKAIGAKSGIKKRYSVIEDFTLPSSQFRFFEKNDELEPVADINKRMLLYKQEALKLSTQAIKNIQGFDEIKDCITHLITVTCTGLFAPGLDVELIREFKLNSSINRSSINFMGCNAAVLALKQAHYITHSQVDAIVLVVCTELCTIHFQKRYEDEFLLSNLIFSDGSASAIVSSKPLAINEKYKPIKIDSFYSEVIHEGENDMAWQVSETGFIVNLTSNISPLLNQRLPVIVDKIKTSNKQIKHWAIHPGGKKILDDFCKAMSIQTDEIQVSYDVLREKGNMSSPTILFVLKELLDKKPIQQNDFVFGAAFGPGLSLETMLLQAI